MHHRPTCPPPRTHRHAAWGALALLLGCGLLGLTGCGYSTTELFPEQYSSVAVPIFDNRTFYRGVEYDLTEAVIKEIQQRTPYRIVASTSADTLLTATVVGLDKTQLSRTPAGGLPQEVEVTLTVDFEWKDQQTGDTLMTRNGFSAVGRYVPAQPIGEPFEVGQHAAVQRLARDLVSAMRGEW